MTPSGQLSGYFESWVSGKVPYEKTKALRRFQNHGGPFGACELMVYGVIPSNR